jgi:hypothetical protein
MVAELFPLLGPDTWRSFNFDNRLGEPCRRNNFQPLTTIAHNLAICTA